MSILGGLLGVTASTLLGMNASSKERKAQDKLLRGAKNAQSYQEAFPQFFQDLLEQNVLPDLGPRLRGEEGTVPIANAIQDINDTQGLGLYLALQRAGVNPNIDAYGQGLIDKGMIQPGTQSLKTGLTGFNSSIGGSLENLLSNGLFQNQGTQGNTQRGNFQGQGQQSQRYQQQLNTAQQGNKMLNALDGAPSRGLIDMLTSGQISSGLGGQGSQQQQGQNQPVQNPDGSFQIPEGTVFSQDMVTDVNGQQMSRGQYYEKYGTSGPSIDNGNLQQMQGASQGQMQALLSMLGGQGSQQGGLPQFEQQQGPQSAASIASNAALAAPAGGINQQNMFSDISALAPQAGNVTVDTLGNLNESLSGGIASDKLANLISGGNNVVNQDAVDAFKASGLQRMKDTATSERSNLLESLNLTGSLRGSAGANQLREFSQNTAQRMDDFSSSVDLDMFKRGQDFKNLAENRSLEALKTGAGISAGDITSQLGAAGTDISRALGLGNIGVQGNRLGLDTYRTDIEKALGFGQLGVSQAGAETQRIGTLGDLNIKGTVSEQDILRDIINSLSGQGENLRQIRTARAQEIDPTKISSQALNDLLRLGQLIKSNANVNAYSGAMSNLGASSARTSQNISNIGAGIAGMFSGGGGGATAGGLGGLAGSLGSLIS